MTVEEASLPDSNPLEDAILTESKEHTSPMATRSRIGIELKDGSIVSSYHTGMVILSVADAS